MAALSEAQLRQRREAGKARARAFTSDYQRRAGEALKSQVSRDYYRFLGRRGGRRFLHNRFSRLAETFDVRASELKHIKEQLAEIVRRWPPPVADRVIERWNDTIRADFAELAQKYYDVEVGNRLMLDCFRPEHDLPKPKKTKKKRGRKKCLTK